MAASAIVCAFPSFHVDRGGFIVRLLRTLLFVDMQHSLNICAVVID